MSTVYVTQETNHDFTLAEEYGDVVFLTHEDLVNVKGSGHNEDVLRRVRAKLLKFNPDEDWIVLVGSPYLSAAIFMMLAMRNVTTVRVLRWDNRNLRYIPLYIEIPKE